MDINYLRLLSGDVQDFVRQVEVAASIEILIRLDESRATRGPNGTGILACDIDETGATILVPRVDYFPNDAVFHEVSHIQRLLVDRIPRLSDNADFENWSPDHCGLLTKLDNALEHLVIVPAELQKFPERNEYWNAILERSFQADIPDLPAAIDQRRWALLQWAFLLQVIPNAPARGVAKEFLEKQGLEVAADEFVAEMAPLLTSKPDLVRKCFERLQLQREMVMLEYLDSREHTSREVPL